MANRSISTTGLELIKKFEGCKLSAYKDSAGVWTIGYGHTSGVTEGMTITQAQADAFLKSDCVSAESAVNKYMSKYNWNQNQFDALVSFAYNIGSINQLTANGTRSIEEISAKITAYNKAGGKVLTGLVKRRAAEKELFDKECASSTCSSSTTSAKVDYSVGKTYTLQAELKVRTGPGTSYAAKSYKQLTADGRKHDKDGDGALDKGTKVTCKDLKIVGSDIWMKTPSGWLAAYYKGDVYIK